MTDERWEALMHQVGGLLERDDVDCAYRLLEDMLAARIRQCGEGDPMVAAIRIVLAFVCGCLGRADQANQLMALAETALLKQGQTVMLRHCLHWCADRALAQRHWSTAQRLYGRSLELFQTAADAPAGGDQQAVATDMAACRTPWNCSSGRWPPPKLMIAIAP